MSGSPIKEALLRFDKLGSDAILFVVDVNDCLIGSLTDGDVRRGILRDLGTNNKVEDFIQSKPHFIYKEQYSIDQVIKYREGQFKIIPILDSGRRVINIVNFRLQKSYLPIDAVVMAGGKGMRLRPLTENTPKPLLKVGDKTIIEHNLDRLRNFGIDSFWITLNYLGNQIKEKLGNGENKNIGIQYVSEDKPLGTIGSISLIDNLEHDYVLLTNSDILTNLDYEDFFLDFIEKSADLAVATIPYKVNIPYAVLETQNGDVKSFKEKPTYTYYSNGGIYLMKREVLQLLPKGEFFNATDLMEKLISKGAKVISYPLIGYWLDIGKHEDYKKAQEDVKHLKL